MCKLLLVNKQKHGDCARYLTLHALYLSNNFLLTKLKLNSNTERHVKLEIYRS